MANRTGSWLIYLMLGLLNLTLISTARADITDFDDHGFYIIENRTGLAWLKLPHTYGLNYVQMIEEQQPGGKFDGWRYAHLLEVWGMIYNVAGLAQPGPGQRHVGGLSWRFEGVTLDIGQLFMGGIKYYNCCTGILAITGDEHPNSTTRRWNYYMQLKDNRWHPDWAGKDYVSAGAFQAYPGGVVPPNGSWLVWSDPTLEPILPVAQPDPDSDGDGVADGSDNCPAIANPSQNNVDGDIAGDACDICPLDPLNDADGDGVCGDLDNCPNTPNPDQKDTDSDGFGDACNNGIDSDGDEYADILDNCPTVANPLQQDSDGDNLGDLCDPDDDNDAVPDEIDNCPLIANGDQSDFDSDSAGDLCDMDIDGDQVSDAIDSCPLTPLGAVVNSDGCAIEQLCPADNPWKNHGAYMKCITHTVDQFFAAGLISDENRGALISAAAGSDIGKK